MKKYLLTSVFIFIASLLLFEASAQVTISPTNLFVNSRNPFGTYMVINGSNQVQEISIDFIFSYTKTDENGTIYKVQDDSLAAAQYSIADYVRAFPRNFTLSPGQRQIVRLRLTPPSDLPEGTYWARIKTASSPESPPLELQNTETVTARVGIVVEQITGLYYKKGNVTTGISINNIETQNRNDTLTVLTHYERTGNSPFLGSISTKILDKNGLEVKSSYVSTTLYFSGTQKQVFDISDLPKGDYTVSVNFQSRRADVSDQDLIQMESETKSTTFSKR